MSEIPDVHVRTEGLTKRFDARRTIGQTARAEAPDFTIAVDHVNLLIERGECMGLVGQSGSGKTTLGMMLALLEKPTGGRILFDDVDISGLSGRRLRDFRQVVQVIFQDPYDSLNPRYRVQDTVLEPLAIHRIGHRHERHGNVIATIEKVGLRPAEKYLTKYPHELSGGERQRVAIARAIILNPTFLVADEPVSMLDVSVRAAILSLMRTLQDELGLTYLFITHDLSVARYMCNRIAIMYEGRIVEYGPTDQVLHNPLHPYTRRLINSVQVADPTVERPVDEEWTFSFDHSEMPKPLVEVEPNHFVAEDPLSKLPENKVSKNGSTDRTLEIKK